MPTTGTVGVGGWTFMKTFPDKTEVQPEALVTVNKYVPASSSDIVAVVPVPVVVVPSGALDNVHVPSAGRPFKITLPVATAHVGWVMVPISGAVGVTGCALMTTFSVEPETHPAALVTVNE